jgi:plasmid stability protein
MAQLIVRNLEDDVKRRLQRRAARHGRSMEDEVRDILRDAVKHEDQRTVGLGTEIAALFADIGFEQGEIPRLNGDIKPAEFED